MYSNLSCYQLKLHYYKYNIFSVIFMVITKQKPIVEKQKRMTKELKHSTIKIIKSQGKRGRKKLQNS